MPTTLAALPVPTLDGDTQTLEQKLSVSRIASGDTNTATNVSETCRCHSASFPRAPNVSTASGTKQYTDHRIARLLFSASTATAQAASTLDAGGLWPVSGHVKSHIKHLMCDHGTSVKPSGRLPSFHDRQDASSLAGISAAVSARFIRLTALCRE